MLKMAWFGRQRLEPLANMAGLGAWAVSQMLLMITLASTMSLELVGVFSLGLTVFSLLMVALGLNLRLVIAVDEDDRIGVSAAVTIRLGTAAAGYAIALAVMRSYAPSFETFLLAALLLSGRIADQIVDVFYGFQQKLGRNLFLSASFFLRGLLTSLFCLWLFLRPASPMEAVLTGSLAYCAASLLIEIAWFRGRWRLPPGQSFGAALGEVWRHDNVRSFSAFPMFDALHVNSFRLAVAPVLDTRSFGLYALAMNAFSAAQIVITALGLTSFARLKSGTLAKAPDPTQAMVREAGAFGAICVGFFALCSLAFGLLGAFKVTDPGSLDLFLAGNFMALLLFPFTGFLAQGSVFFGNRAGYWQAPLAGSLAFAGLGTALVGLGQLLHWAPTASYLALCSALFVSCLVRIAVSLHHFGALRPVRN